MRSFIRIACFLLMLLFVVACGAQSAAPESAAQPTSEPAAPIEAPVEEESVVFANETPEPAEPVETFEPLPTEEPTPAPTEAPTPEPTETPEPTRAPLPGEIAVNFPDYDTGVDADYSYQSDNLRIAITVHEETMKDHLNRKLKETYYVADIWIRSLNSFRLAFSKGEYGKGSEEPETLACRENAIFAVNGNYNQGLTLESGVLQHNWRRNKGWNSCAIGVLYKDGSFKSFRLTKEVFDLDKELKNGAWHAWQFGPIVIRNGEEGPGATEYHNMGYKARNILGYYEPGHYVIMTCDNRGKDAQGMNEYMMVDIMKSLGVKEAFNLDGGTSAVMVFMGKIINHPTLRTDDGKSVVGRPIVDMLVFGEYDENGNSPDLSTLTPAKCKGRD